MTAVLTFQVSGEDCPLPSPAPGDADVTLELDRVVPLSDCHMPLLWVTSDDQVVDAVAASLERASQVIAVSELERSGDGALLSLEWSPRPTGLLEQLVRADATVLSASGSDSVWTFQVRFPSQDTLSSFSESCRDAGIALDVLRIGRGFSRGGDGVLTADQRETLVRAYETGFYKIPREKTAVELADDLGISDQALSERLRRGHERLVEATVF
ncbi:MAG TPA: helix-turn-helix domain-containing protein [Halobacteriales archaeon]|nr:helix-turn-helix domain-containing protein [Halobacteriales archaeon]